MGLLNTPWSRFRYEERCSEITKCNIFYKKREKLFYLALTISHGPILYAGDVFRQNMQIFFKADFFVKQNFFKVSKKYIIFREQGRSKIIKIFLNQNLNLINV